MTGRMMRRSGHWLPGVARAGHVAVGVVYILVGALAIAADVDRRVRPSGPGEALSALSATAVGRVATIGVAAGLIADALWQAVRAWRDLDRAGSDVPGLVDRVGAAFSGLLHLALAIAAARLVLGYDSTHIFESETRSWLATVFSLPLGGWLVALAAAVTFAVAVATLYRAAASNLLARLNLAHLHGPLRTITAISGRLGLGARGIVYTLIAAFLTSAAYHHNASHVRAVGGVLRVLQYDRYGRWLLTAIAIGFVSNGAVELLRAWRRTIRT